MSSFLSRNTIKNFEIVLSNKVLKKDQKANRSSIILNMDGLNAINRKIYFYRLNVDF